MAESKLIASPMILLFPPPELESVKLTITTPPTVKKIPKILLREQRKLHTQHEQKEDVHGYQ